VCGVHKPERERERETEEEEGRRQKFIVSDGRRRG
jgi:hypothetical protein